MNKDRLITGPAEGAAEKNIQTAIDLSGSLNKKQITFFADDEEERSVFKRGEVVRLKRQYGDVSEGSIGIMVYYLSKETFNEHLCQVIFYNASCHWDTGALRNRFRAALRTEVWDLSLRNLKIC